MQLQQIDRVRIQVLQAALNPRRKILAAVAFRYLLGQAASSLGGDVKLLLPFPAQFCHQPFAVAVAVNVCRVEEIHATVECGVQRSKGFLVVHIAPGAADGPRAETDFRDLPARATEFTIFHARKLNEKFLDAKAQKFNPGGHGLTRIIQRNKGRAGSPLPPARAMAGVRRDRRARSDAPYHGDGRSLGR